MQLLTDNIVEGDEDFFLRLSSADPLLTIDTNRQQATVTINDLTSMFTLDILITGYTTASFFIDNLRSFHIMKQFIIQGLRWDLNQLFTEKLRRTFK